MSTIASYVFQAGPFLLLALGLVAAASDVSRFRIPNWVCAALVAVFVAVALAHPFGIDWWGHLGTGAAFLALGLALYLFGVLGAGDGKLLAAMGLWVGWEQAATYLLYVVLLGGALALALLATRRIAQGAGVAFPCVGRMRFPTVLLVNEPVPYGLAIVGGMALIAQDLWMIAPKLF